jgi:DNA-binding transcriptional LysR family regulator
MKRSSSRPVNVTLRQMRAFVAAAGEGSVTRAAQQLHLTPSALSMLIRGLEAELAVRLFDRVSRRMELTAAGRDLLPALQGVFESLDRAFDHARSLAEGRHGRLTVATSPLLAAELMPRLIASFQARFPAIRVVLMDLGVEAIGAAVKSGRADVGICTAEAEMPGLELAILHQDRMMLACPTGHLLAARRAVRWREIAAEPLVLMQAGTGLRSIAERAFAELGEKIVPAHEVAHVSTAVGLVAAGLGLAILPAYALTASRAAQVVAVPLTEPVVHRDIVAATPAGRSQSGACEAFLAHFREALTESGHNPAPVPRKRG